MCGIAGIIAASRFESSLDEVLQTMAEAILHRGPDDSGVWSDVASGVGLAHRRLAIVDLTPAGHQPMTSPCGRYVLVFNGEIYNHLELRKVFNDSGENILWRGHSDTETLIVAIAFWGLEKALKKIVGMFALALWDRKLKTLYLARDRMGEKPLYYGMLNEHFFFASELKAIRTIPNISLEIDRNVLHLMMRYGYIPDPYCIYKGVKKLSPGRWLEIRLEDIDGAYRCEPSKYWSALEVLEVGCKSPQKFSSDEEAVKALDSHLRNAVHLQMMSDVPFGAFLSGGVDSSIVAALMQAQSIRPIKTFSIGFDEDGYNEAHYAKAVAQHLKTEHTELYVTAQDALNVIPLLPSMYDEPFADVSQIPTYLVSHLARKYVAVSLSGDGGDELFCGYARYFLAARLWTYISKIPLSLRHAIATWIVTIPPPIWDTAFKGLGKILQSNNYKTNLSSDKLQKFAKVIVGRSGADLYHGLTSHCNPAELIYGGVEPLTQLSGNWSDKANLIEQMMAMDSIGYLPGDILTKVDRAAMFVSLETRAPLLDHRVFEFAASLPLRYKVRNGQSKWLLRQVLYKYVPRKLIDRPKMGFGVPIDSWLRGPLREWGESLIEPGRLKREGYLQPEAIHKKWREHQSGRRNWQYLLWNVLMFQAWLED